MIPRDEWLSRQHVGVRPTKFIVIDRLGDIYDEAIYRIEQENTIGVASTGIDVCRNGTLCWIQVYTYKYIYVVYIIYRYHHHPPSISSEV